VRRLGIGLEEVMRAFIEKDLRSHCKASGLPVLGRCGLGAMLSKALAEAVLVVEEEWQEELCDVEHCHECAVWAMGGIVGG